MSKVTYGDGRVEQVEEDIPYPPEYRVVTSSGIHFLSKEINQLLCKGWEVVGGISQYSTGFNSENAFIQAMIKHPARPS